MCQQSDYKEMWYHLLSSYIMKLENWRKNPQSSGLTEQVNQAAVTAPISVLASGVAKAA